MIMENISDKEVVKKKKRRGRKKSTSKVASPSVKKEEVLFNTAHLEKIKEEVSEKINRLGKDAAEDVINFLKNK